jgi:hypothetical protein
MHQPHQNDREHRLSKAQAVSADLVPSLDSSIGSSICASEALRICHDFRVDTHALYPLCCKSLHASCTLSFILENPARPQTLTLGHSLPMLQRNGRQKPFLFSTLSFCTCRLCSWFRCDQYYFRPRHTSPVLWLTRLPVRLA